MTMASSDGSKGESRDVVKEIEHFETVLQYLRDMNSGKVSDNVKAQINSLYEKLSFLMAQWYVSEKSVNDYRIDEILWGDEYTLKYCFEDCVMRSKSKKDNDKDELFCLVCKEYFVYSHEDLVSHLTNCSHLSKCYNFKSATTDGLWEDALLLRCANEKFIDVRCGSALRCNLCGVTLSMTHFALMAHLNGDDHEKKFKEVVGFKVVKKPDVKKIQSSKGSCHFDLNDPSFVRGLVIDCSNTTPVSRSFIVKDGAHSIQSFDNYEATVKDSNADSSSVVQQVGNGDEKMSDVEKPETTVNKKKRTRRKGKSNNNNNKVNNSNRVSAECLELHDKYMSKLMKLKDAKALGKVNYLCQACNLFETCTSTLAIDEHQSSMEHENMVLLKQNLDRSILIWSYCCECNANFFSVEDLFKVHQQSKLHDLMSTLEAGSINKNLDKRNSIDSKASGPKVVDNENHQEHLIMNEVNFTKVIGKCIREIYNLEGLLRKLIKNKHFFVSYCLFCHYYAYNEKSWKLHSELKAHQRRVAKGGTMLQSCNCQMVFICNESFYDSHLKSVSHQKLSRLVSNIQKSISVDSKEKTKATNNLSVVESGSSNSLPNGGAGTKKKNFKVKNGNNIDEKPKEETIESSDFKNDDFSLEELQYDMQELDLGNSSSNYEKNPIKQPDFDSLSGEQQIQVYDIPETITKWQITRIFGEYGKVFKVVRESPNSTIVSVELTDNSKREYIKYGNFTVDFDSQYYEAKVI